jgi:NAD(P)H dehydrogenase (quinone)
MPKTLIPTSKIALLLICLCFTTFSGNAQKILITYYSESGYTSIMAKSVAEGAKKVDDAEVRLLTIEKTSMDDLLWADSIIVGSPVHSANIAAAVQEFIRTWPFQGQELKDKIGAVFVTGGGISAGEELAQMNLIHTMMVFNMIVVGGPTWDQPFGASAVTGEEPFISEKGENSIDPRFLQKGSALGERVSIIAKRFSE